MQLFAGQPSKFHSRQVTFSADELQKLLGDTTKSAPGAATVPTRPENPNSTSSPACCSTASTP